MNYHALTSLILLLLSLFLLVHAGTTTKTKTTKTRVFVLAGQSNMEGKGSVEHLRLLLNNSTTYPTYKHLVNQTTHAWIERDDVSVRFFDRRGKLTVGYGVPAQERFGVELEFGHVLGNHQHHAHHHDDDAPPRWLSSKKEQILLLKVAWGGRALAVEFRPLLSCLNHVKHFPCPEWQTCPPFKPMEYSNSYRDMMNHIQTVLKELQQDTTTPTDILELSGFVWFQGWNDVIDPRRVDDYGANLANLIRNVRLDLDAPNLPFVIGELGQHGVVPDKRVRDRVTRFRQMQENVTKMEEFRNTTRFVKTSPYVVKGGDSWDGDYHYYGRADTFVSIGGAFGRAMLELLQGKRDVALVEGQETTRQQL